MNTEQLLTLAKEKGLKVVDAISSALTKEHPDPHRRLKEDMEKLGAPRMHTPAAPWAKAQKVKAVLARQAARRLRRHKARLASGKGPHGHTVRPRKARGIV